MLDYFPMLAVRDDGDDADGDLLYPIVDETSETPRLAPGESLVWQFPATVMQLVVGERESSRSAWSLPTTPLLTVTDRRIVWVCRDFKEGSTWIGGGLAGAAIAGTAMATSAIRARRDRRGRAAVGQVRFEWLSRAALVRHEPGGLQALAARTLKLSTSAVLQIHDSHGVLHRIVITARGPKPLDEPYVRWVAGAAAHQRLTTASAVVLSAADRTQLEAAASQNEGSVQAIEGMRQVPLPGATRVPVPNVR